ncbi:MAG: ATP synthase F1 subunit delta [Bacteroidaceae bacterium]|nr:ATP synthase F1 subunit delta [Bacteroidaceae bacterium]
MNIGHIAHRYAKALLAFARERNALDVVHTEVLTLMDVLDEEEKIPSCVKSLSEEMHRFLQLVISNGRVAYLPFIFQSFINQYNRMAGITTATLTSATTTDDLQQKILDILQRAGYTKVDFSTEVNPELLGGFVLRIDDLRLDASLATQLKNIRAELDDKNRSIV